MAPLQIPMNIRFRPIFLCFSKLQDEAGPFLECPLESSPSTNELSHLFMFNSTCEGPFKNKKNWMKD